MPRRLSETIRRDQRAASIKNSVALTNALEDVVHERVEDEHRLVRDSRVGVDLLEDLVDVVELTERGATGQRCRLGPHDREQRTTSPCASCASSSSRRRRQASS